MAGTKFTEFSSGDVNLTALMSAANGLFKGYNALTITEMNTTAVPVIAAGSQIEINGALYKFTASETITGSPSDGVVYIYLIPSGVSVTATFTNTAPIWSDEKQGYYDAGGNYRYVNIYMTKSGSTYLYKRFYEQSLVQTLSNWPKFQGRGQGLNLTDGTSGYLPNFSVALDNRSSFVTDHYVIPENGTYMLLATINYWSITGSATAESEVAVARAYFYDGSNDIGFIVDNTVTGTAGTTNIEYGPHHLVLHHLTYLSAGTSVYIRASNPSDGTTSIRFSYDSWSIFRIS